MYIRIYMYTYIYTYLYVLAFNSLSHFSLISLLPFNHERVFSKAKKWTILVHFWPCWNERFLSNKSEWFSGPCLVCWGKEHIILGSRALSSIFPICGCIRLCPLRLYPIPTPRTKLCLFLLHQIKPDPDFCPRFDNMTRAFASFKKEKIYVCQYGHKTCNNQISPQHSFTPS